MKPTLIALSHRQLGDSHFRHGEEIPPDKLEGELRDYWLDHKWAQEHDRRSLYRLFAPFSGVKDKEQLAQEELDACGLPE
jgi:hypothetical protein